MRTLLFSAILAGLVGAVCGGLGLRLAPAEDEAKPTPKAAANPTTERFDKLVREDMFAGFGGDEAAMTRGLAKCDAALANDPKHAEALVWRGAVRVFQASRLFAKKEMFSGMSLWSKGLRDMDDAVSIAPHNAGVRIPRAAVLLPAARSTPKVMSQPLLDRALDDYLTIAKLQASHLDKLGTHPLGELRMGLADIYRLSGESAKSREQLELLKKQLPDTEYAERAQSWLDSKPDAKLVHNCIGCHGQ